MTMRQRIGNHGRQKCWQSLSDTTDTMVERIVSGVIADVGGTDGANGSRSLLPAPLAVLAADSQGSA